MTNLEAILLTSTTRERKPTGPEIRAKKEELEELLPPT